MTPTEDLSAAGMVGASGSPRAFQRGNTGTMTHQSAICWGAIFAGSATAAALSLLFLMLGAGLGLLSISALSDASAGNARFDVSMAAVMVWLVVTQLLAFGSGGYLAGRLRAGWTGLGVHENYFRDTAHGFLTWAVAWLAIATLLAIMSGSIVGSGFSIGLQPADALERVTGAHQVFAEPDGAPDDGNPLENAIATLFRAPEGSNAAVAGHDDAIDLQSAAQMVAHIFIASLINHEALRPDNVRDIGVLVSAYTGLSQQDAKRRVESTYAGLQFRFNAATNSVTKNATDQMRKTTTGHQLLWLFALLLIGGLAASWAATYGGRRRCL